MVGLDHLAIQTGPQERAILHPQVIFELHDVNVLANGFGVTLKPPYVCLGQLVHKRLGELLVHQQVHQEHLPSPQGLGRLEDVAAEEANQQIVGVLMQDFGLLGQLLVVFVEMGRLIVALYSV